MSDYIIISLGKRGKSAGKFTSRIDSIDSDLGEFNWSVRQVGRTQYAARQKGARGNTKVILLHREIMRRILGRELLSTEQVDHKDGDGLNNLRANLRISTYAQNQQNRSVTQGAIPYKGVCFHKTHQKYLARIYINGKAKYLGLFDSPELAYAAYCEAAKELFGEFANFGNNEKEN